MEFMPTSHALCPAAPRSLQRPPSGVVEDQAKDEDLEIPCGRRLVVTRSYEQVPRF